MQPRRILEIKENRLLCEIKAEEENIISERFAATTEGRTTRAE
jgi:hypothetical protein